MLLLEHDYGDAEVLAHLQRIHKACFSDYDLADVVRYIEEQTYLNGDRFSFRDHEFQKDIVSDTHPEVNVQKCAQVGMSEIMARYALAVCRVMPYFSTILTMPGANDASNFFKTRIDAVINDSPDLRNNLDTSIDNTEMKGFGGSLLYGRGTRGSTAALSVPADLLIHDELDRSDPSTIQQYVSRLKHSSWKMIRRFGTPTQNGVGIAAAMAISKRYRDLCKCNHCNHWFAPNYHDHVVIPGYSGTKQEVSPHNLMHLEWEKAYLACPKCGKEPSLQRENRSWVCENPNDNFAAKGYFVTPFSVPNVVPISRIVQESTLFKWPEFCNQTLGETSSESGAALSEDDIRACIYNTGSLDTNEVHAMGVDLGAVCYFTIGRRDLAGRLHVVHRERVPLALLHEARERLMARYKVITSVWDWQPYTDTVIDLQSADQNLYAARYAVATNPQIFTVRTKEESEADGQLPLKLAIISREVHFDEIMKLFQQKRIIWQSQGQLEDELFIKQCLDMKRSLQLDKFGDSFYSWVKAANDQDHFHHSLGYLNVACLLLPTASTNIALSGMPLFSRIKVATRKETTVFGSVR